MCVTLWMVGCTTDTIQESTTSRQITDARELTGIRTVIEGGAPTRAGTVTRLANYVGRNKFVTDDKILFTRISRTESPITNFVYPNSNAYDGITFQYGSEGAWSRLVSKPAVEPERVYWTDAQSPHTFIAYSTPQTTDYDWKKYQPTAGSTTYFLGSLGDPTKTGGVNDTIDFNPTYDPTADNAEELAKDSTALAREDLLIAYDTNMQAETGGSVALVKFYHALSSVRVVVNISGFASTSTSADVQTTVSNMKLLHQPTMYVWKQTSVGAQPLNAGSVTDQPMVNTAWEGANIIPAYDQRKTLKLWIPNPAGTGSNQSKTFVFYGITTPQPSEYMSTLTGEKETYRTTELEFTVTYPDPLKPMTNTLKKTYKASIKDVYYEPGYNTTINVTLNHKDEQMTVGAEYENWQFVATPDVGELKKNSTLLQSTDRANIYLHDEKVNGADVIADDATWLYQLDDPVNTGKKIIYDIYGHTGTEDSPYQISTAYQLLAFAYEVKNGMDFEGKFIRLDADLTLQASAQKTTAELAEGSGEALDWIGIGDEKNAFNGTFIGGQRYIYRLKGKPLFANIGSSGKVKKLQVSAVNMAADTEYAVAGGGLFAETNAGRISGCQVVGDVSLSGTDSYAGAFVGKNTGAIYASYHIGNTKGLGVTNIGGLVGNNENGTISCCFQAGVVSGGTTANRGIAGANTGNNIYNTYFDLSLFDYSSPSTNVVGKTTAEMTKEQFVTDLNTGISVWLSSHTDYDNYQYVHQPANYPKLKQ